MAEMDVDKVSSHPCHRLSIPAAQLFWCRHCMQKFEDPISRWRHSRSCKTDGPVNHSRRKEKEAHAYQLYIESSNLSMPEPTPLPPPVVLTVKPLAGSSAGTSGAGCTPGQPSDLSCYICKKEFRSMEEMKAHVRDPCNKTKDTSEFPFEVPEHLKPVETSLHSVQARRQRETSRFSTISRKPSIPTVVEPIRVYPRTLPAAPIAFRRAPSVEIICAVQKQVSAGKTPSKELSLKELLTQLADGGGEVEVEEEMLEDCLAKEAEQLLSLPQPPGAGDEDGKENGGMEEEEDIEDIFPFHPSKPKPVPSVDRTLEERLEVPEPAANVEIDQTEDGLVLETTLSEEGPVTDSSQDSSCCEVNSSEQEEDAVALVPSISSKGSDESKDAPEETKPQLKPTNRKAGRQKPETDTEKENNSKSTETKRKRTSSENDPVLRVKRTRRATQKAEALQEEKRLRQRGKPELRKLKKSPENDKNVTDSCSVSKSSKKEGDSDKANSASFEKTSDSNIGPGKTMDAEKDLAEPLEGDPHAESQQAEVKTEVEKDTCQEELSSSEKSSSETSSVRMDTEKSQETRESQNEPELSGSEAKSSASEIKKEPSVPPSTDKKTRKGKTDKPVKCKVCDRTFKSAQHLHRHTRFPCKIKHTRNYTQKMLRPKRALPPKPSPKPVKKKTPRAPKKIYKIWPFELKFDSQFPVAPSNRRSKKRKKRRSPFPEELPPREKTIVLPDKELLVSSLEPQEQFLFEMGLVKMDHLSAETRANIQIQLTNQRPFTHLEPLSVKVGELPFCPPVEAMQEEANEAGSSYEVPQDCSEPLISPPILEKIDFSMEAERDSHDIPEMELGELEPPTLEPAIPSVIVNPGSIVEDAPVLLSAAAPGTTSIAEMPSLVGPGSPATPEGNGCASSESVDAIQGFTNSADAGESSCECPSTPAKELQPVDKTAQSKERPNATTSEGSDSLNAAVAEKSDLPSMHPDPNSELQPQDTIQETTSVNELPPLLDFSGKELGAVPQEKTLSAEDNSEDQDLTETTPVETERSMEEEASISVSSNMGKSNMENETSTSAVNLPACASEKESCSTLSKRSCDNGNELLSQDQSTSSVGELLVSTVASAELPKEHAVSEALPPSSVTDQEAEEAPGSYNIDSESGKASGVCGSDPAKECVEMQDSSYEVLASVAEAVEEKRYPANEANDGKCETQTECSAQPLEVMTGDKVDAVSTPLSVKCDGSSGLPSSPGLKLLNKGSTARHFLDLFAAQDESQELSMPHVSQPTESQQPKSTASSLSVSIPQSPEVSPAPCTPSPSRDVRLSPGGSPLGSINFKQALKNLGTVLKKEGSSRGRCLDFDQADKIKGSEPPRQAQTLASSGSGDRSPAGGHSLGPKSSDSFQNVDSSDSGAAAQSDAPPCSTADVLVGSVEKALLHSSEPVKVKDSGRMKMEGEIKHRSGHSVQSSGKKDMSSSVKKSCHRNSVQKSCHRNPPISKVDESDRGKLSQSGYRDRSPISVHAENMVQSEKQQRTVRHHHKEEDRRHRNHQHRHREPPSDLKVNHSPVKNLTPDALKLDRHCNGTGKGQKHKSSGLLSKQSERHGKLQNNEALKPTLDPHRLQKSTDRFYSRTKSHDLKKKGSPTPGEVSEKLHVQQHGSRKGRRDDKPLLRKRHRAREDKSDSEWELQPAKKMKYASSASGDQKRLVHSSEVRKDHHVKVQQPTQKSVHATKTSLEKSMKNVKETSMKSRVPSSPEEKESRHNNDSSDSETTALKNGKGKNNHSVTEEKRNLFESFQPQPVSPCAQSEEAKETVVVVSSAVSVPGVLKSPSGKNRSGSAKKRVSFAEKPIVHDIPSFGELAEPTSDSCVPASNLPSETSPDAAECESAVSLPDNKSKPEASNDSSTSPPKSVDVPNSDDMTSSPSKNEVLTLLSNLSPLKSLWQKMCRSHGDNVSVLRADASSPKLAENCSEKLQNEIQQSEQTGDREEISGFPDKARQSPDQIVSEVGVGTKQGTQTTSSGTDVSNDANARTKESTVPEPQAEQPASDLQESNRWNQLIAIITEAVRTNGGTPKDSTTPQPSKVGTSMPNTLDTILPGVISALVKNSPQKMNTGDICRELIRMCQELKAKKQRKTTESLSTQDSPSKSSADCLGPVCPSSDLTPADGGENKGQSGSPEMDGHASDWESEEPEGEVVEEGVVCEVELMEVNIPQENSLADSATMDEGGDQGFGMEGGVTVEETEAVALGEEVVLEVIEEDSAADSADGVAIMFLDEKDIEDCSSADLGLVAEFAQDSGVMVMSQDCLHAVEQEIALVE